MNDWKHYWIVVPGLPVEPRVMDEESVDRYRASFRSSPGYEILVDLPSLILTSFQNGRIYHVFVRDT